MRQVGADPCKDSSLVTDHRVLLLETICVSPVAFLVFVACKPPAPEQSGEGPMGCALLLDPYQVNLGRP